MEEQYIKEYMALEFHEFTTNSGSYIEGFISRRKEANNDLRTAENTSSRGLQQIANKAAFYNRLFNAAVNAFKGDPSELLKELEGAGK